MSHIVGRSAEILRGRVCIIDVAGRAGIPQTIAVTAAP
jgi:hypothetical protein